MHLQLASFIASLALLQTGQSYPSVSFQGYGVSCSGQGLHADPHNCNRYYHCDMKGQVTSLGCAEHTAWNDRDEMCDEELYLLCYGSSLGVTPDERRKLEKALADKPPRLSAGHEDDSSSSSATTSSTSFMMREVTTGVVHHPTSKHITKDTTTDSDSELRKRQVDTTPPDITDTASCTVGEVANVPNPTDCTKYTFCEGGFGENLVCPTGQMFDSWTSKCMDASKAHCCE